MYICMSMYLYMHVCNHTIFDVFFFDMLKCSCSLCVTCLSVYLTLYVKPPSSII